jgi:hypothetical protein
MDDIKQTSLWNLYERGVSFNRSRGLYADTDKNYRFYNGDQWFGLQSGGIEPISLNIIKPIVKYKVGTINSNLWAINYSAENIDEFRSQAKEVCELLNKKAAKLFEKDQMDFKIRKVSKQAGINAEGLIYVHHDEDIRNEIVNKNDVCYGNENSSDIQTQPYIILKSRKPVNIVREIAKAKGVSKEEIENIVGDKDYSEESGEEAKREVNDMCILLTKMWKENGTVHFSMSTKYVDIVENKDSGLKLYPLAHLLWEEVEGSARGEGEVKWLTPNQIEINRTLMRRALTVKMNAYPKQIVNTSKLINPQDVDKIGVTLRTNDIKVDDVAKLFKSTIPASMSTDAEKLQLELIDKSRELAGAGDIATGQINPEQASGRAILAVKQASEQPLVEQVINVKTFIEDLARIYLDIWKTYPEEDLVIIDEEDGEEIKYTIPKGLLEKLQASVRVDITPKGAFDKYAQEMSLENLFTNGAITFEEYVESLDHDSIMPKVKLEAILEKRKVVQQEMAQIENQAFQMESQMEQMLGANEQIDQIEMAGQQIMGE